MDLGTRSMYFQAGDKGKGERVGFLRLEFSEGRIDSHADDTHLLRSERHE